MPSRPSDQAKCLARCLARCLAVFDQPGGATGGSYSKEEEGEEREEEQDRMEQRAGGVLEHCGAILVRSLQCYSSAHPHWPFSASGQALACIMPGMLSPAASGTAESLRRCSMWNRSLSTKVPKPKPAHDRSGSKTPSGSTVQTVALGCRTLCRCGRPVLREVLVRTVEWRPSVCESKERAREAKTLPPSRGLKTEHRQTVRATTLLRRSPRWAGSRMAVLPLRDGEMALAE